MLDIEAVEPVEMGGGAGEVGEAVGAAVMATKRPGVGAI